MTHPTPSPPTTEYLERQKAEPASALSDIRAVASKHSYLIVAFAALLVGSLLGFTVGHMSGTPYELRTRADQIEKDLKAELAEKLHGSSGVEK